MILVIGGRASGKTDWVKREYGYSDSEIADGVLEEKPVINRLQNIVRQWLDQGKEPRDLLFYLTEKEIVVCDEMGCGIVPTDEGQNRLREETGRLCVLLAENAAQVVRMICGIPQWIKGEKQ